MKTLLSVLFALIISPFLYAQELKIDEETKKVTYWEVVDVEASKDQLFKRSKNFGTADKESILKDDAANGVYSTKGKFNVSYPSPMKGLNHTGIVEYTLTVYAKEGKYKYVFTDFKHSSPKGDGGDLHLATPACGKYTLTLAGWSAIKKSTAEEAEKLVESLKNGMKNPSKNSASSTDW